MSAEGGRPTGETGGPPNADQDQDTGPDLPPRQRVDLDRLDRVMFDAVIDWLKQNSDEFWKRVDDTVQSVAHEVATWESAVWLDLVDPEPWSQSKAVFVLERHCRRVVEQDGGIRGNRNKHLYWTAKVLGRKAVEAGVPVEAVEDLLRKTGLETGLREGETERTTRSGVHGPTPW